MHQSVSIRRRAAHSHSARMAHHRLRSVFDCAAWINAKVFLFVQSKLRVGVWVDTWSLCCHWLGTWPVRSTGGTRFLAAQLASCLHFNHQCATPPWTWTGPAWLLVQGGACVFAKPFWPVFPANNRELQKWERGRTAILPSHPIASHPIPPHSAHPIQPISILYSSHPVCLPI